MSDAPESAASEPTALQPAAAVEHDELRRATIRRAPRIGVFMFVGIAVGVIVAVAITTAFPADPDVGMWATVAYVSLYGVAAGAVLGGVAALIADRVSRRRAKPVEVERGTITLAPQAPTPDASASDSAGPPTASAPPADPTP